MTLRFPFWYFYTSNAFIAWWIFHFRQKNCSKMCLKINRSVKTPWHRSSVGVALSGLWAAVCGVTRWGGLSGLKCWNSDNLFDWIDFFKINTYFYFFDERQNVKQKPRIFWKHGVVPFDACSLQLIRTRSARNVQENGRGRILIAPFLLVDKFFLLNFIGERFLCSLNCIFMCSANINCVD